MQRFKSILVVFDRATGSREALDQAADLAERNGARLDLLVCLTEFDTDHSGSKLQEIVIRGLHGHFSNLVEPFRDRGIPVSVQVVVGRPFLQAIRAVLRNNHDLVVKTAENAGHHGFRFGSTDLHLLRKCPRPVWILRTRPVGTAGAVLAAVAPAAQRDDGEALNIKIMELASSLARQRGQTLHVAQGWTSPDPMLLRWLDRRNEEDQAVKQDLDRQREQAIARFNTLVDPFNRGVELQRHFIDGVASDILVGLVDANAIDMVVMATVTRSGVPGLLIGQTAEDVLRRIGCSVLALKPDGFVSPVAA